MQLGFSGDTHCSISIEGQHTVAPLGRGMTTFNAAVEGASMLLPLLGHTVTRASVPTVGTVRLGFDDDSVVEVLDSEAHYESYQISLGDRLLIV